MNANSAMIFDFSFALRKARHATVQPRVNISEALDQINRCSAWLAANDIPVMGFVCSTLHSPVVYVAAHPRVWSLFSNRALNPEHRRDGALRFDVWSGFDRINKVSVLWEEVSACA